MNREEFANKWAAVEIYEDGLPISIVIQARYNDLLADLDSLSLPPAESAEAIVKKYEDEYDFKFHWVQRDRVIRMMREFAAQPQPKLDPKKVQWSGYGPLGNISQKPLQPTAEGAEEILLSHPYLKVMHDDTAGEVCIVEQAIWAIEKAVTLHAQRIADKMVEERLKEELMRYDQWLMSHDMGYDFDSTEQCVDEYLNGRNK